MTVGVVLGSLVVVVPGVANADPASCFDRTAAATVSERRVDLAAPQELLRRSGFDRYAPRFERVLCSLRSPRAASEAVRNEGPALWRAAVDRVQGRGPAGGDLSRGDDRPLYWARLQFTRDLRQWKPSFPLSAAQRTALVNALETGSRGQDSVAYPSGVRRVLVSGFDPFQLDADIRRSNPSGANALALDGVTLSTPEGPVRVETAMFPVLYQPFEEGMVEHTFLPYIRNVDMLMTVSQGRIGRIDVERTNGRWHTGPDNDNANRATTIPIPTDVPTVTPQPEWVTTTLPYAKIIAADTGRFPVFDNTTVTEIRPGSTVPVISPDGPTPGSVARAGSGGSYLSNEIAYRATLLRDATRPALRAGHVHTPVLEFGPGNTTQVTDPVFEQNRTDIVAQMRAILTVAVG
jgi:pyrrolidone-carboxylate peptidase